MDVHLSRILTLERIVIQSQNLLTKEMPDFYNIQVSLPVFPVFYADEDL